jgi:hypothetical protein
VSQTDENNPLRAQRASNFEKSTIERASPLAQSAKRLYRSKSRHFSERSGFFASKTRLSNQPMKYAG